MTHNHAPGRALAANLAARMLDGAGDMNLVPYLVSGQKPMRVVRHGLNNRGELMVTCFSDEVPSTPVAEVRVDVTLQAPMFRFSLITASLHALGQVQWFARGEGWFRGVVVLGRVYVHHYEEPQGFDVAELPMTYARVQTDTDRIGAYDVVAGFGDSVLGTLLDAACLGIIDGYVGDVQPFSGCSHLAHRIFVADVCQLGITFIRTTARSQSTVFIPFPGPVHTLEALRERIYALALKAASTVSS